MCFIFSGFIAEPMSELGSCSPLQSGVIMPLNCITRWPLSKNSLSPYPLSDTVVKVVFHLILEAAQSQIGADLWPELAGVQSISMKL